MSDEHVKFDQYDDWLKDGSDVAAIVMRQWLKPIEEVAFGDDDKAVIFPPTYATSDNESPYNIDRFDDGTSVCQIDSVGSQANRMEPIFKREEYKSLVPEVIIQTNNGPINLLDAGHRAADAVVRFTFGPTAIDGDNNEASQKVEPLGQQLWNAYEAWHKSGDAEKLAKIAPTSIVFGSWDSRATQAKLPRIVRSVIRAYNVKELHRSAQYSTIAGQILGEGEADTRTEGAEAELGLTHVPAVKTHGGVEVHGGIRRDAMINLVALRSLSATSGKDEDNLTLRRYVLGLGLIAFTADQDGFLREGCHLVPDTNKQAKWSLVKHDGNKGVLPDLKSEALGFADAAARSFGVKKETITATFAPELANAVLAISDSKARKKLLRNGPITKESLAPSGDGPEAQLKKMKKPELHAECEKHGLPTEGKKDELVERLLEFHAAEKNAESDEETSE